MTFDWTYCGHVSEEERRILADVLDSGDFASEADAWDALYDHPDSDPRYFDAVSIHSCEEHRVTCGNCGKSWCERCDPAPSALCHWCNGRGHSIAELPNE